MDRNIGFFEVPITLYDEHETSDKTEFIDQIKHITSNAGITLKILDYNSPTFAHDVQHCSLVDPDEYRYTIGLYHPENEEICLVQCDVDDLQSAISFWRDQLPSDDVDILVIPCDSGIHDNTIHDQIQKATRNLNLNVIHCKRPCFMPHRIRHIKAGSLYPNLEPTNQLEIELDNTYNSMQNECKLDNQTMTLPATLAECRSRIANNTLDSIVIIQTTKIITDECVQFLKDIKTLSTQNGIAYTYINIAVSDIFTIGFCAMDFNQNGTSPAFQPSDESSLHTPSHAFQKPGLQITPSKVGALVLTYFENGSVHAGFLHRDAQQICYLNEPFSSLEAYVRKWLQWIGDDSIDLIAISRVENDGAFRFMASIDELAYTLELDFTRIPYFPGNAVTVRHFEREIPTTDYAFQKNMVIEISDNGQDKEVYINGHHNKNPGNIILSIPEEIKIWRQDSVVVINYDEDGHDYCEQIEKAVRKAGAQYTFIDTSSSVDHLSPECVVIEENE